MSANDHTTSHDEGHSGPIRTPKQLLLASALFFIVPVFIIIGLVFAVTKANKPAAGAVNTEKAVAMRIQKIGSVEIRDVNRVLKSGEEVYKAQCTACHAAGLAGAPKTGDTGAWAARIKTGYDALLTSALKGKGAMGAQGGGEYDDIEIGRAVVYLTNAAPVAAAVATAPVAAVKVAANAGEALYKQACSACHVAGVAGAPKSGDKAAWAPRIKTGIDAMTASVIKGKGAMPPKGGSAASDAEIRATVEYMASAAK